MKKLQRLGGIAALIQAVAFIVGFWVYFTLLEPASYGSAVIETTQHVVFLVENRTLMYTWNLIIYILFGVMLVVLTLSLYERLKKDSPLLIMMGTAFGLIWSGLVIASGMVANIGAASVIELYGVDPGQAASLWHSLDFVTNGLGGGNEIVGGLWTLLISGAAWRGGGLPRHLNIVGFVVGAAGLLTTVPPLEMLGAVFGLGLIVWFIWLGAALMRSPSHISIKA